jgi:hypothetical protein
MKIVYTFAEYQSMINATNAILPEVLEGFPGIELKDALGQLEADGRITVDYEKQEISMEIPERMIIGVHSIVIKHAKPIAAVAKAIKAVAEAMKSLMSGVKDDVEKLVSSEIEEAAKEQQKQAA